MPPSIRDLTRLLMIVGGIGAFVAISPPSQLQSSLHWILLLPALAGYAVAFGLLHHFQVLPDVTQHTSTLLKLIVSGALAMFVLWGFYSIIYEQYTANYQGTRRWVGSEPTIPRGQDYFQKNRNASPEKALQDAGGVSEDIWTAESIRTRKIIAAIVFWPLISACVFFLTTVVYGIDALMPARFSWWPWIIASIVAVVAVGAIIYVLTRPRNTGATASAGMRHEMFVCATI